MNKINYQLPDTTGKKFGRVNMRYALVAVGSSSIRDYKTGRAALFLRTFHVQTKGWPVSKLASISPIELLMKTLIKFMQRSQFSGKAAFRKLIFLEFPSFAEFSRLFLMRGCGSLTLLLDSCRLIGDFALSL